MDSGYAHRLGLKQWLIRKMLHHVASCDRATQKISHSVKR